MIPIRDTVKALLAEIFGKTDMRDPRGLGLLMPVLTHPVRPAKSSQKVCARNMPHHQYE